MALGIALGGGGFRAAFHIGVLKAFEEDKINIDYISGSSSGAIIAALHACGFSSDDILKFFNYYGNRVVRVDKKSLLKCLVNSKRSNTTINKVDNLEKILFSVFKNKKIEDIEKKIAICCVDANFGETIYFANCSKMNYPRRFVI